LAVATQANPARPDAEVIIEWNELLQAVVPAGGLSPPRYYAMLHVAMSEAAAAQAGHDILVALFTAPDQVAKFDAALQARLNNINPYRARLGIPVGKAIAKQVLDWRAND